MTLTTLRLSKTGGQVAYQERGSGEPLVLLHGVGMQSAAWAAQITVLSERYHVIALDLPGHGGSDSLPVGSLLPDFVDWCHAAISALNLGRVNLAGHSMGAMIAAGFAVSHADMVRRVAVLNGVFCRDAAARAAVVARAAKITAGQVDFETPLARWFDDTPIDQSARTQVAGWLKTMNVAGYATAYTAFAQGDATYSARFPEIACPFLALTGDGDANSTSQMAQTMSDQVQNGRVVVIKGHRHMANLTAAAQVNAHMLEWLKVPERTKVLQ